MKCTVTHESKDAQSLEELVFFGTEHTQTWKEVISLDWRDRVLDSYSGKFYCISQQSLCSLHLSCRQNSDPKYFVSSKWKHVRKLVI